MALLRQSGADRLPGRGPHDEVLCGGDEQAGGRASQRQGGGRARRPGYRGYRRVSLFAVTVTVAVGLLVSLAVFQLLFREHEVQGRFKDERWQDKETKRAALKEPRWRLERSLAFKKLRFGKGSLMVDGDSRYWDRDDRRRDENYEETSLELSNVGGRGGIDVDGDKRGRRNAGHLLSGNGNGWRLDQKKSRRTFHNEVGHAELKDYDDKFEESLKQLVQSQRQGIQGEEADDEYDDGFHMEDTGLDSSDESENDDGGPVHQVKNLDTGSDGGFGRAVSSMEDTKDKPVGKIKSPNFVSADPGMRIGNGNIANELVKSSISGRKKTGERGNRRHRRFSGRRGCEMKFLNSSSLLLEPLEKKKFSRFSLRYKEVEERPDGVENWEPRFAGHQTLQEREESFFARDQNINCGFIKCPNRSQSTGFDIAEDDIKFMSSCHIAVSSCIFGNSDRLRTPNNKMIKRLSRKAVCFVMFVDQVTLQKLSTEGQKPDGMGFVGLWRIIVVKNLPYTDMRRAGKIPKFLAHRLFPSARYSIWLDSKLRLTSDPLFLLEYFLWRKGNEYAISNHYDQHCVWEEVMQNKRLNKFNHTLIDQQFAFYQSDGLTKFNSSDPDKLLPSYVPEGSFILRAHTSMSNLFSCLWFNEVDRFTPRDQLSFAYTFLKLRRTNPDKPFYLNMFKDCERRALAKLYRHRSADKWNQVQSTE